LEMCDGEITVNYRLEILKVLMQSFKTSKLEENCKMCLIVSILDLLASNIRDEDSKVSFVIWLRDGCIPTMEFLYNLCPTLFRYERPWF